MVDCRSVKLLIKCMISLIKYYAHESEVASYWDLIYFMSNRQIIENGTYQQLIESNEEFKRMANLL